MKISTDLDETDLEILRALQRDGRIGIGVLAEGVGLSSPAVSERLRKLEEKGVIRGYMALLNPALLALDITAFILVRVDSSAHYAKFLAQVAGHAEVMECHAITGEASHLLKIRTRNTSTLESLLADLQRMPGVIGTQTSLVLSTHKETLAMPLLHIGGVLAGGKKNN